MKRIIITITIVVVLAGLSTLWPLTPHSRQSGGLVPSVQAQEKEYGTQTQTFIFRTRTCSLASINGRYAVTAAGTIIQPIPQLNIPAGPYGLTGLFTFNDGQFTGSSVQSFNGLLVPPNSVTGSYTLNSDCTGTAVDSFGVSYFFVVASEGKEIQFIFTIPGTTITGQAKRL